MNKNAPVDTKADTILSDKYGRKLDYLRLSIIDHCNLRCQYCMPEEGVDFTPSDEWITIDEMNRIVSILREQGLSKIRITGGEPLIRPDFRKLMKKLHNQLPNLYLTTNASLLHKHLEFLENLPLNGINISLDSLEKERFEEITRRKQFKQVYENILAACESSIPVKINCVLMQDKNVSEIPDFIKFAEKHRAEVRFIEEMPFNGSGKETSFLDFESIKEIVQEEIGNIEPQFQEENSTSAVFEVPGFKGSIGIIPAFTRSICGECNRLRISADGKIRTCLYASDSINIVKFMRQGMTDEQILAMLDMIIDNKAEDGFEAQERSRDQFISMTKIGG